MLRRLLTLSLVSLFVLGLAACGAGLQGEWHGTIDKGPVESQATRILFQDDTGAGRIEIQLPNGDVIQRPLCAPNHVETRLTFAYDAAPGKGGECREMVEPVEFEGTFNGESLITGTQSRGKDKIGFLRAFRQKTDK